MHLRPAPLLASLVIATSACLSPGPPLEVRSFEPFDSDVTVEAPAGRPSPFMLAGTNARAHLDLEMVWRLSPVELEVVAGERWIAPPEELVADRLRHRLFIDGPYVPGDSSDPQLAVEVHAFEGLREEPPAARVELVATWRHVDGAAEVRAFEATIEIDGRSGSALARGMGLALDACLVDLCRWLKSHADG